MGFENPKNPGRETNFGYFDFFNRKCPKLTKYWRGRGSP